MVLKSGVLKQYRAVDQVAMEQSVEGFSDPLDAPEGPVTVARLRKGAGREDCENAERVAILHRAFAYAPVDGSLTVR
jgi:hypothetical protein